jgi:hypothetical protein
VKSSQPPARVGSISFELSSNVALFSNLACNARSQSHDHETGADAFRGIRRMSLCDMTVFDVSMHDVLGRIGIALAKVFVL